MEYVDILIPPYFEKSWIIKPREQAINDWDWIWTFNLWIIKKEPIPSIIYQIRSPNSWWCPWKFDVSVGWHYLAWESFQDWIREAKEELWKNFDKNLIKHIWKKINVSIDTKWRQRKNIVDIWFIIDNCDIYTYNLDKNEVYWISCIPIEILLKIHTYKDFIYELDSLDSNKSTIKSKISKDSFPYNLDNYHFKIAVLAKKFIKNEDYIIY